MSKTISQFVIGNARNRGVSITGRGKWGLGLEHMSVYAERRKTHPHGLLPRKPCDTLWCHITVTDGWIEEIDKPRDIISCMRTLHEIGWSRFMSGVSYNFAIHAFTGDVGVGQALDAKGTHTVNKKGIPNYSYDQNAVSLAIAFIGMPGVDPTPAAMQAYSNLVAALIDEGALTKEHDFNPHSMVAPKDCPTDNIREVMPVIHRNALKLAM